MGPDETASNRLGAVFEATDRAWEAELLASDDHLAPDGRVMEVLERAPLPGLARGLPADRPPRPVQLLRGVHPHHRLDVQPARQVAEGHARDPLAAADRLAQLPALLARLAPGPQRLLPPGPGLHRPRRQQEGGDRPRLPAARRQLPAVGRRPLPALARLRQRDRRRQAAGARLPRRSTRRSLHCTRGLGIWEWASNDDGDEPDVVLACAGDVPTLETLAAAAILRERLPELRVRVVNVVDLMRLQPESEHPHGLSDSEFDALFTTSRPVIFAYHGYPWLIHRLTYRRANHDNIHVRGYKEEGTTTTPFDMVMLNDLDRFHLVIDVDRPRRRASASAPRTCARRWSTRGCATAPTRARTATIRPRSATGPGRAGGEPTADVGLSSCASSSSTPARAASSSPCSTTTTQRSPQRELAAPRAAIDAAALRDGARRRARRGRRRRAPDRPRRRALHASRCAIDAERRGGAARAGRRSRRCTSRSRSPRSTRSRRRCPSVPAVACFDTAFHATLPPAAAHLRAAGRVARALGHPPLRLPRALARLGRPPRAGAARA